MKKITGITKRISYGAAFAALALTLSLAESLLPIALLVPIPGVKIGLANIVTVFSVVFFPPPDALAIVIIRSLVSGLFTGPVSMAFSLAGGLFSWFIMTLMVKGLGKVFSITGISMAGALFHSLGQIFVAVLLMKDWNILFYYLPILLTVSIFTGIIIGIATLPVIKIYQRKLL